MATQFDLALGAIGAAVITAWALSKPGLTGDNQALDLRTSAGHTYGLVLVVSVLLLAIIGIVAAAEGFASDFNRVWQGAGIRLTAAGSPRRRGSTIRHPVKRV